jgi:hypothetical protein
MRKRFRVHDLRTNRLGPSLYGVIGRKAGTEPNCNYSDSVKGSGITWDEPTLDKWITDPNALIPGNNMGAIFCGVADPDERKKIISFLKQDTQTAASTRTTPRHINSDDEHKGSGVLLGYFPCRISNPGLLHCSVALALTLRSRWRP